MKWRVTVEWPEEKPVNQFRPELQEPEVESAKVIGNERTLKAYLDGEVFCLRHGCPLPVKVSIERMED